MWFLCYNYPVPCINHYALILLQGATADLGDLHGEPSKVEEVTTEVVPEAIEDEQIVMASPVAMVPNLTATVETGM